MRILVVEDEPKLAHAVKRGLEQQAYAVDVELDGDGGLAMAMGNNYDLIILDRMLPGSVDGMGILAELRKSKNHTPVLLLTAKDKVLDRAHGLNSGADDYLVKPFAFVELVARVRALLRRPAVSTGEVMEYAGLSLDPSSMSVVRDGEPINLSAKEFALLQYFMTNPGRVITKEELIEHVWDFDSDILPNTVEAYVMYVRTKVEKPFKKLPKLIHTKRGFGYVFGAE